MNVSKYLRSAAMFVPAAVISLSACSDSTGPSNGSRVSVSERLQLMQVFSNPNVAQALVAGNSGAGAMGIVIANSVQEIGTVSIGAAAAGSRVLGENYSGPRKDAVVSGQVSGNFRVFAAQIEYKSYIGNSNNVEDRFFWSGVIAIDNLNNPTRIIAAGAMNMSVTPSSFPDQIAINDDESPTEWFGTGTYLKLTGSNVDSVYYGKSGNISFTSPSIGSTKPCPFAGTIPQGIRTCTYGFGSINTIFNFSARHNNSDATVTIPEVSATLPLTKMLLEMESGDM